MKISLKNLNEATAQQVFDQVAEHLLKQRAQSKIYSSLQDYEICAYRGDNGMMCAAGCLIADDEYSSLMENVTFVGLFRDNQFSADEIIIGLIQKLQDIHDTYAPELWHEKLEHLARIKFFEWKFSDEA